MLFPEILLSVLFASGHNNNTTRPLVKVNASDLTYYLSTPEDPKISVMIKHPAVSLLQETNFNPQKNTVFIIHGWSADYASPINTYIQEAMLTNHDVNVFVVDWSTISKSDYFYARSCVTRIGELVAQFVMSLVEGLGLSLNNVVFVGHSLGAHIAGNAGAQLNGEVDHIVGLDPVGIMFTMDNTEDRLDSSDAKFVQVIHTHALSMEGLGFTLPIGHADYYPNGLNIQPGCGMDYMGVCSHSRAYYYYAESLQRNPSKFTATRCDDLNDIDTGECNGNIKSYMGGFPVDKSARGMYFLYTNSRPPYSKG